MQNGQKIKRPENLKNVIKIKYRGDLYASMKLNSCGDEAITDDGMESPASIVKTTHKTENKNRRFLSFSISGVKKKFCKRIYRLFRTGINRSNKQKDDIISRFLKAPLFKKIR